MVATLRQALDPACFRQAWDRCVHELIAAQEERTPHAVALAFRDRTLTYQELNRLANKLTHRLRALGVGPSRFVDVFLKRSLGLIVALLATLKVAAEVGVVEVRGTHINLVTEPYIRPTAEDLRRRLARRHPEAT